MIKTMKGKLLLALGITLIIAIIVFLILAFNRVQCEWCGKQICPPCPTQFEANPSPIFLIAGSISVVVFAVIFLILHLISKYKK